MKIFLALFPGSTCGPLSPPGLIPEHRTLYTAGGYDTPKTLKIKKIKRYSLI